MRPTWFRVVRPLVLSLVILSCATENAVGPIRLSGPAAAVVAGPGTHLIITEVMPDPSKVADASGEWFEVYNAGDEAVELQGSKIVSAAGLTASESHTIASSVVVDAGEYIVFGNNANASTNGGVPVAYSYGSSIALNNGSSTSANEWLALRTAANVTLDSVAYAVRVLPAAPGPYVPPSGASRALLDLSFDNTIISSTNWGTSVTPYGAGDKGTPGQPNSGGPAASITVRISWVTPGTTFRVTASAVDADGKPSATNFSWSVDRPSIATIDPVTGVATGVSLGVATLTATATNGVSGTAPLFVVNPGDVASISISINDPVQVPAGFTKPAFPTTRTTTNAIVTPNLTWTTTDPSVATVSELGYVTGVGAGTTKVRATAPDGVYGELAFTVLPGDAPTTAVYGNHVEFGAPVPTTGPGGILLEKRQYVESYNPSRGGPNWVSWVINSTQFGAAPRCDCFSADQALPSSVYHVVDFDYRNGGYDRGHMVQSESRTTTDQENASTFLLTNILPQGAENNQGPWSKFENYLNDQARASNGVATKHEVYVVAGGIYGTSPETLKGEGKVAIPDYTWKIAVVMPDGKGLADVTSAGDLEVIAIKMPNLTTPGVTASSVGIRNNAWEQYKTTVDEIERETGYDFLSKLPDNIEVLVEANDRAPIAVWNQPPTSAEGTEVNFDASASSDPDVGDALTYAWDFGDGTVGSGATVSHAFADNGNYEVTLTVRDRAGAENTLAHSMVVSNVAPRAILANSGPVVEGSAIALSLGSPSDPSSSDFNAGFEYRFDCGDGFGAWSSSNTASCPTTDNPGFNVRAEIKDKDNGVSSYEGFGSVTNAKPSVVIATPSAIYSGQTFSLSAGFADLGQQDSPWNFTINWGNGTETGSTSAQGAISRSRTYTPAGSYTLSIAVTDKDGGTGTSTASLRVLRLPTALGVNPAQINTINKGTGQVVVTVFGSSSFGADLIDIGSVRINGVRPDLRGNGDANSSTEDRNGDGIADLVVHFERSALVSGGALNAGTAELVLQANLTDGRQIEARGPVNIATRD